MGAIEIKYFNSFILRKTLGAAGDVPVWNGSRGDNTYGNPSYVDPSAPSNLKNWAIEESRIRGGYNNVSDAYGVKAYLIESEPNAQIRSSSLIYSGIFNSRTGINDTNVFSVGTDITKSLNPANGSIQRIYAENTNLTIFQESKISSALVDKDAIYSAEGGGTVTSSNLVIGAVRPYSGRYGISKNPESFAYYGNRKYFTDKDRNAVLRLSKDGLTEISKYGMTDYFRDKLSTLDASPSDVGKAIGSWDMHTKQYVVSLQPSLGSYNTVSFDEDVNGFPSFFDYKPDQGISMKSDFYTMKDGVLYLHYKDNAIRSNFYGTQFTSSIKFVFNPKVSMSKVFKTVNYEGSNGWQVDSFLSDITGVHSVGTPEGREGNQYELGSQDTTAVLNKPATYSYNEGSYDDYGNVFPASLIPPLNHAGFDRKENKYMANLINTSAPAAGEIVFGADMTGIKGYFATVTISNDQVTDVGGAKELFAVSSQYVESSY